MKKANKIVNILLVVAMIISFVACSNKESAEEPASEPAAEEEENQSGMPNPWSDVGSGEEAAKGAGLDEFSVPDGLTISLGAIKVEQYRCMDGIAEAIIPVAAVEMTIRKGKVSEEIAQGDISGDYNEYTYDWTCEIDGKTVKCFGNREGEATKSIWTDGEYDYAILAYGGGGDTDFGLSEADLTEIVSAVK